MFSGVKAVIFDLDGTIYEGKDVIDGALEAVKSLEEKGYGIYFMTNNSSKTREQIASKLRDMGFDCDMSNVYNSGSVAAAYLAENGLGKVYIAGSDGLRKEVSDRGVSIADDENEAENILVGYTMKFDYDDVTKAMRAAMRSKKFIACNRDRSYPGDGGLRFPGCGAMVAPIEWCSGKSVDLFIGKPGTVMVETLCRECGFKPSEVVMVGDTYEADIVSANAFGCRSVLIGQAEDTCCIGSISELPGLF